MHWQRSHHCNKILRKQSLHALLRVNIALSLNSSRTIRVWRYPSSTFPIAGTVHFANKLMTGVQITPRRHSQILGTGTAAGQTLCTHRGLPVKSSIKWKKLKSSAISLDASPFLSPAVSYSLQDLRNVLFADSIILCADSYNRLYGHLLEAKICKMQHVLSKNPGCCRVKVPRT